MERQVTDATQDWPVRHAPHPPCFISGVAPCKARGTFFGREY